MMLSDIHPHIDMVRTGINISIMRKQKGLSVSSLQDIFGFATPQAIYKWERGITLPTVDNLIILSYIFNTSIDSIMVIVK